MGKGALAQFERFEEIFAKSQPGLVGANLAMSTVLQFIPLRPLACWRERLFHLENQSPHELSPRFAAILTNHKLHVLGYRDQVLLVLRVRREMDQGAVEALRAGYDLSLSGRLVEGDQALVRAHVNRSLLDRRRRNIEHAVGNFALERPGGAGIPADLQPAVRAVNHV